LKLLNHWYQIQAKIKTNLDPYVLSGKIDFITDSVKVFYNKKVNEISIDSLLGAWKVYKKVLLTKSENQQLPIKIKYYANSTYFIKYFGLDLSIYSLLQSNLTLNTGGSIVIEKTEALTAIDINSGSFNHIRNSRATLLWINCEAATEIATQLKLRNIGGIIVIDFIDMAHQKDQMKLLTHLNSVLQTDQGYTKIIQLSEIGLIELTRKREGQNIYDAFSYDCYKCNGLGYQIHFGSVNIRNAIIRGSEHYHNYMHDFIKTDTKASSGT
jgi:ribonuclease E